MTLRTVNLSDPFGDIVADVDGLCSDVGDLTLLTTSTKASIVAAVNEINAGIDSAAIVSISREAVSAGTGLSYDSGTGIISLNIPSNTITYAMMADSAIGTAELRNDAVTTIKIADNAVTFAKMADSAVGTAELRNNAVTYQKMQTVGTANRVLGSTSGGGAVSEVQIQSAMIASGAVDSASLKPAVITSSKLASAVTLIIYNSAGTAVKTLYGAGS